ncbi:hypothetical protein [Streptomyces badius]|uniref:H-type lectin domain-containing protein n=1 Tax=Streptomyces badius TaxID=1941 RepID=A0ABQ2TF47_STRBA|nr:hypothetical protein [Streptomyces badius]GGS63942.1 hypothetical protein GCM10010253_43650 [Streptomyces badius]
MATTDDYGQGVSIASRTDAPDAETLAKNIANGIVSRSVLRYASASARTAALAGAAAPVEGMITSLADTDRLYRYNGTSWVALAPLTQIGTATVSFTSQVSWTQTVTFPTAFPATPVVNVNIASAVGATSRWGARATSITPSQFTLFLFHTEASDAADSWSSVPVQWHAVSP